MYPIILATHSLVRWLVLLSLLFAIFRAYRGWLMQKTFASFDNSAVRFAVSMLHLQFVIGVCLYVISPITSYFLHNFKTAVHERQIRFFGMEHVTVMFVAVALITMGASLSKLKKTDSGEIQNPCYLVHYRFSAHFIIYPMAIFAVN